MSLLINGATSSGSEREDGADLKGNGDDYKENSETKIAQKLTSTKSPPVTDVRDKYAGG